MAKLSGRYSRRKEAIPQTQRNELRKWRLARNFPKGL